MGEDERTTIQIKKSDLGRIDSLRAFPKEPSHEVISRLLDEKTGDSNAEGKQVDPSGSA